MRRIPKYFRQLVMKHANIDREVSRVLFLFFFCYFFVSHTLLPKRKFGLESTTCTDTSFTPDVIGVEINAVK
jgi:hypothetical protein